MENATHSKQFISVVNLKKCETKSIGKTIHTTKFNQLTYLF